mmetsp:Transcript_1471/g.4000  ORF Transcript_1471/g.4000 Transcript_1471/m.4000 type:complete len:279 (+) Transcript_1471:369-1205(+)|eukprot:CAMPEP_0194542136 /NCGR_PEP_ID=MMETSP0253-20130528/83489_1 /TAXON_ID=2966 /ORGANISM="Noctiluca scintillans" /LENGTH=278 /DNA_ID=CAMNT_0039388723 /DNA_START=322 /DNA_END=1158 /DNA_ORIENTATION=+
MWSKQSPNGLPDLLHQLHPDENFLPLARQVRSCNERKYSRQGVRQCVCPVAQSVQEIHCTTHLPGSGKELHVFGLLHIEIRGRHDGGQGAVLVGGGVRGSFPLAAQQRTSDCRQPALKMKEDGPPKHLEEARENEESADPKERTARATGELHHSKEHGDDAAHAHAEAHSLRADRGVPHHEGPIGGVGHASRAASDERYKQQKETSTSYKLIPNHSIEEQRSHSQCHHELDDPPHLHEHKIVKQLVTNKDNVSQLSHELKQVPNPFSLWELRHVQGHF